MRAPSLLLAVLLLAGCLGGSSTPTTTQAPAPAPSGPAPRSENYTLNLPSTVWNDACVPPGGGSFTGQFDAPQPIALQPLDGDKSLRATLTWTATNPTDAALRVAVSDDNGVLATAQGPSPLKLDVPLAQANLTADAGNGGGDGGSGNATGGLRLALLGPACGTATVVLQGQVAIAVAWNATP